MNSSLRILLFVDALVLFAGAFLSPIFALFVQHLGGTLLTAASSWGVFCLVAAFVTFFLVKIEDRLKESELAIALGYCMLAFGYYAYLLVENITGLLAVQALLGLGVAVMTPAYGAVFFKHLKRREHARGWSLWQALGFLAAGCGALIGGTVATFAGYATLFTLMGTLALLSALVIVALPRKLL